MKQLYSFMTTLFIITKNLEATKMFLNRWLDKEMMVHPYNGVLLNYKINDLSSHEKTQKNLKSRLLVKNSE